MKYILYIHEFEYESGGKRHAGDAMAVYEDENPNKRYTDRYPNSIRKGIKLKIMDTVEQAKDELKRMNFYGEHYFRIYEYENGNIGKCVNEQLED